MAIVYCSGQGMYATFSAIVTDVLAATAECRPVVRMLVHWGEVVSVLFRGQRLNDELKIGALLASERLMRSEFRLREVALKVRGIRGRSV